MLIKVVAIQARMGQKLTLEEKIHIFKQRPDFVCLPEYYLADESICDYHRAALFSSDHLKYLQRLSDELSTCLIAGTVVEATEERLVNTCYVMNRGLAIGRYGKRYPVAGELERGISPGDRGLVMGVSGARIGVMICGDVFHPHLYDEQASEQVDVLFVPTTSPFRPADSVSQKRHRDEEYFLKGAERSCAYVVKVCGIGRLFGKQLQGRSLFAAPWGIIQRVDFTEEAEKRILVQTLDIVELREFRRKMSIRNRLRESEMKGDQSSQS